MPGLVAVSACSLEDTQFWSKQIPAVFFEYGKVRKELPALLCGRENEDCAVRLLLETNCQGRKKVETTPLGTAKPVRRTLQRLPLPKHCPTFLDFWESQKD